MPGPSQKFPCRSRGRSPATSFQSRRHRPARPPRPMRPTAAAPAAAAAPAPAPPVLAPATRQHAALPPPRKHVAPAAVAATSSTSQADKDALENVIELVRKQKPGGRHPGAGRDIGSGRPQARGMADPAQRQQWRLRRALSRLRLGQSELAVADLPAPAHRGCAVGRPPRRRHGLVVVRKRIADFGQGQVRAGKGDDRARRSHQCRTAGARGLAQ